MKIVMVVNNELPAGLIANTTAVLGISLGNLPLDLIGDDCLDSDHYTHKGITKESIPVLSSNANYLSKIYRMCLDMEDIELIGFNTIAQSCRDYNEYMGKLSNARNSELTYSGLCLYGKRKKIDRMTGSLGLLK